MWHSWLDILVAWFAFSVAVAMARARGVALARTALAGFMLRALARLLLLCFLAWRACLLHIYVYGMACAFVLRVVPAVHTKHTCRCLRVFATCVFARVNNFSARRAAYAFFKHIAFPLVARAVKQHGILACAACSRSSRLFLQQHMLLCSTFSCLA